MQRLTGKGYFDPTLIQPDASDSDDSVDYAEMDLPVGGALTGGAAVGGGGPSVDEAPAALYATVTPGALAPTHPGAAHGRGHTLGRSAPVRRRRPASPAAEAAAAPRQVVSKTLRDLQKIVSGTPLSEILQVADALASTLERELPVRPSRGLCTPEAPLAIHFSTRKQCWVLDALVAGKEESYLLELPPTAEATSQEAAAAKNPQADPTIVRLVAVRALHNIPSGAS